MAEGRASSDDFEELDRRDRHDDIDFRVLAPALTDAVPPSA
jgi:hypothetical protein